MSIPLDETPKRRPPSADPGMVIWRYIDVYSFLTLMHDQCLAFHQFKGLQRDDEREGMVPDGFWESMPEYEIETAKKHEESNLGALLEFSYANCWNMGECENALMWKAYAPDGVAIRTTVGKFEIALRGVKWSEGGGSRQQLTIEYADNWEELRRKGYRYDGIPLNVLFLHLKRRAFAGEAEVRFSVQPHAHFPQRADGTFMSADRRKCKEWCSVTFETLGWIDEVVTAPSVLGWAAKPISRLAEERGLNFRRSGLSKREAPRERPG